MEAVRPGEVGGRARVPEMVLPRASEPGGAVIVALEEVKAVAGQVMGEPG